MKCCLVIPSFRDVDRLRVFLPRLVDALSGDNEIRLLVVDDGSGPDVAAATRSLIEMMASVHPIGFLPLPENLGKGGAVYAGWDTAGSVDWLGFLDADGATPAGEVRRMIRRIDAIESAGEKLDGLIASRVKMLGRRVERSVKRHFVGRSFATLAALMTGVSIYDSQCGCKFFRRACYQAVKSDLTENRFGFDMDLLYHLLAHRFRLEEFPVDWADIPGSKVSLLKDSWLMFQTLVRIRRAAKD